MKNKKTFFIFLLFLIIFTISIIHKLIQNDTFFTIKTGEYILKYGIDEVEPFTFHENLKFVKLRWAFDILIYLIYSLFNIKGIHIFVVIFSVIIASTLYYLLTKRNTNNIIAFLITIFTIKTCCNYLTARAQIISYLIFILEIYSLYKLAETNNNKYGYLLILFSFLILSFHSSVWLAYLVFFLPFLVESLLKKIKFLDKFFIVKKYDKKLFIFFIIVVLTGFLTPLKLSPFTYMPKVIHSYSKILIYELQPLKLKTKITLGIVFFIPLILSLFRKIKFRLHDIFYIFGCYIMATLALRNVFIAFFVVCIPYANIINDLIFNLKIEKLIIKIDRIINNHISVRLYILLVASIFFFNNYTKVRNELYIPNTVYPVGAVNYIKDKLKINKIRIWNDFNVGSYVEFNGIKSFLDSRSEVYCEEFNDTKLLKEYDQFTSKDDKYIYTLINKYKLTHILIKRNTRYKNYIYSNNDFKLLYEDDSFLLFEVKKYNKKANNYKQIKK